MYAKCNQTIFFTRVKSSLKYNYLKESNLEEKIYILRFLSLSIDNCNLLCVTKILSLIDNCRHL